ncbi:MAG: ATP-dependent DNA helicase RecG [Elusimicrobia bacterium]|nr:ATP-dependent DNA helicase RecG [Elusimicrobiota bacterium]MDE2424375.1 ATP-dependent DNA helicase RecG [Elusimicrobiota bacterium]
MTPASPTTDTPLQFLKGVGPKRADIFRSLGVETVLDLLYYFPREWQDRSETADLSLPTASGLVVLKGRVLRARQFPAGPSLALFKASLAARQGDVEAVWFKHLNHRFDVFSGLKKDAAPGSDLWIVGRAEPSPSGIRNVRVEEHYLLSNERWPIHVRRLTPIYPLTQGLSQRLLRELQFKALSAAGAASETIPPALARSRGLLSAAQALRAIHFPGSPQELDAARSRLAYEELLLLELAWSLKRRQARQLVKGFSYAIKRTLLTPFRNQLGFVLTGAQKRVINEIFADLQRPAPMTRLLQGDVGSGKTVVALAALLLAVENGHQGALMAPTEVLAEQHLATARRMLRGLPARVALLTSRVTGAKRKAVLAQLARGEIDLVIGTHALLETGVALPRLRLAVIDEQHRFGVRQRATLRQKGGPLIDLLIMTATPIPRTLALSLYGDLDVSTIDELPPGKARVETLRVGETEALERLKAAAAVGQQAYVVYPVIEDSADADLRSAKAEFERLRSGPLASLSVDLIHGAMPGRRKTAVMEAFAAGRTQVLVATQVIEVGIDVPNATIMVIQNADRFGLASLHQLRGRIGRGAAASACCLVSASATPAADQRLKTLCSSGDGFRIAEEDLRLRGPGEFLGTCQHGELSLRAADLVRDASLLAQARDDAETLLARDQGLSRPENRALKERLLELYGRRWNWIDLE